MASPNTRRFNSTPSPRILALARPRESKTVWLTTPVNVTWGNQETIWPPFWTSLKARNMSRILALSQPKKDFSALHQDLLSLPHTKRCEHSCPVWHISSAVKNAVASPRILQLAQPRHTHPEYQSNRQNIETCVSRAANSSQVSLRLEQLCVPKLRESKLFYQYGCPESPIRPVSKAARNATASARVKELSIPKSYTPP